MGARAQRVLVVDDEPAMRMLISANLQKQGYATELAVSGVDALEKAALEEYDLVVLDLTLGDMDGLDVLTRLREWSQTRVIILSARGEEHEKVHGLNRGADDYMSKPFGVPELLARVRASLRRTDASDIGHGNGAVVEVGLLKVNLATYEVSLDGKHVSLTPIEWSLLRELARHVDKVVPHTRLLEAVWGRDQDFDGGYLRTYIKQLRKKVEPNPAHPRYILNEPGVGYRLCAPQTGDTS